MPERLDPYLVTILHMIRRATALFSIQQTFRLAQTPEGWKIQSIGQ